MAGQVSRIAEADTKLTSLLARADKLTVQGGGISSQLTAVRHDPPSESAPRVAPDFAISCGPQVPRLHALPALPLAAAHVPVRLESQAGP